MATEVVLDETKIEFLQFKEKMEQVQDKFIRHWTGEDCDKYIEEQKCRHKEAVNRSKEEIYQLQSAVEDVRHQAISNEKVVEKKIDIIKDITGKVDCIRIETDGALTEKERLEKELGTIIEDIENVQNALQAKIDQDKNKKIELERNIQCCKDRLKIRFEKIRGTSHKLQVIFSHIDQKDPAAVFVFSVAIVDRLYEISDCDPAIADLEELVKKLNETNNFRSFLITMRKKFQDTCK